MDEPIIKLTEEHRQRIEEFRAQHRTGVLTLLFTDVVDSTALKRDLGDTAGNAYITEHQKVIRHLLTQFPEAEEINTAGDSFFIVFIRPSDGVRFALLLQPQIQEINKKFPKPLALRIGIHMGEVFIQKQGDSPIHDILGIQVDTAHRVMSLAGGKQILLTRSVFDNARAVLRGDEISKLSKLSWMNHGPYRIKGVEEMVEVCEVGEEGKAPLLPPADSEKAQRFISAEAEPVLGWRPALEQTVPGTEWVLEKKLGEGGFGEVWLARNKTMKDQRVFKFCFRADRVRSLKREVTLFRLLKGKVGEHPHIVRLYDVYFDKPPYYIVMEYVEGKNLNDWCKDQDGVQAIDLETRVEIVAQVAEALQAAHSVGILHRDIKSSNILIQKKGTTLKDIQVKLADFGIGQVISKDILDGMTNAGFTETFSATEISSHSGSRLYMAPEVLAGDSSSIQSDIYSLGVVLYQLIIGNLTRPLPTDWRKNITDPILAEDLIRCFAGDPTERFGSALQLAENLRSLESRRMVLVKQEKAAKRKKRFSIIARISLIYILAAALYGYIHIPKYYQRAALIEAAEKGDTVKLDELLKKGVDINTRNKDGETALIRAIEKGQIDFLDNLFDKGADVNAKTKLGNTPLMYAAKLGAPTVTHELLTRKADVNAKNNNGETAVMQAVFSGYPGIVSMLINAGATLYAGDINQNLLIAAADGDEKKVQELLQKGANTQTKTPDGDTALILAARNRRTHIVQILQQAGATAYTGDVNKDLLSAVLLDDSDMVLKCLEKGADINTKEPDGSTPVMIASKYGRIPILQSLLNKGGDINVKNNVGITALMEAARYSDVTVLQILLHKGAEVDAKDFHNRTALIFVTYYQNDTAMAQVLLDHGADINTQSNQGGTPLMHALEHISSNMAQFLIDKGADINIKNNTGGYTALMYAVKFDITDIAQVLLNKGVDPNIKNGDMTPLMLAVKNGNIQIVQALLSKKADINAKDKNGFTALSYAANNQGSEVAIIQILLSKGADINAKSVLGNTPLYLAAMQGQTSNVKVLLDKGAEVDARDSGQETPLMQAVDNGFLEIVQLLLKKGANINAKDHSGSSPIMYASSKGNTAIVKILLEKGAELNEKNDLNKTALMLAQESNHTDIVEMLKKAGAKE